MHAGAMLGVTRREHAGVGVQAAVRRQERGVNVEHPAEVVIDEPPRQNAHETRERDHVRPMRFQRPRQRVLEGGSATWLQRSEERRVGKECRAWEASWYAKKSE